MARLAGQIDIDKNEAILDAALDVLSERGVNAPMEEIARRANVSKQTIYNHYGSKAELVRALSTRRVMEIAAPLETPEAMSDPATALASYARVLLKAVLNARGSGLMRMAMIGAPAMPEVAQAMYEAGPKAGRERLAAFLREETAAGRIACPDPAEAAQFFSGMVMGARQTAALLGVDEPMSVAQIDRVAEEATARFLRAYSPTAA
jgi:AcrR family transcriptional regulator